jgi:HEAT repeat protein
MSASPAADERASILASLESEDEEVRRVAVERLQSLPVADASERLYACLGDASWRVRKAAVERVVARGSEPVFQEMLITSLADGEDPGRRNSAFEALVGCGATVTDRLIAEISSADPDVRKLVVDAMAAIQDPEACDALVAAVDDPDANVRAAAAEALGAVGTTREFERLMRAAREENEEVLVRLSALRALARLEASVEVASLTHALDDALLRPAAFELLGHSTDPEAVDALMKGLAATGRSSRESAMAALLRTLGRLDANDADRLRERLREAARSDADLVDDACERLDGADLTTRLVLIQFLGLLEDARAVVPILLAGRDEAVEELADTTLEGLGGLVPEAFEACWNELDTALRSRACTILGRIGGECAERLLADAVASPDTELRCRAASALAEGEFLGRVPDLVRCLEAAAQNDGRDGGDEAEAIAAAIVDLAERSAAAASGVEFELVDLLESRLNGAAESVRLAIAQVLARVGREQDAEVIDLLLKDESPAVRRAAVRALARFDFERVRDAIRLSLADESSLVRIEAAKVLGESGRPEAIDELRGSLGDEDPRVVAVAIRAIGRLYRGVDTPSAEITAFVSNALTSEPDVALAGFDALVEIGGAEAGRLAATALRRPEPDVVRAAVACLGVHGSDDDLTEAIPLVAHADWSVRAEVARALAERGHRKSLPALRRRLEVEDDAFVREAIVAAIGKLGG